MCIYIYNKVYDIYYMPVNFQTLGTLFIFESSIKSWKIILKLVMEIEHSLTKIQVWV